MRELKSWKLNEMNEKTAQINQHCIKNGYKKKPKGNKMTRTKMIRINADSNIIMKKIIIKK